VVHTGGNRRRGKPRSRILYWFRTPPGVRVGRSALDEEAIRLIEEHNPDVEFDWTRILTGQDSSPAPPAQHKERRGRERPPTTWTGTSRSTDREPPPVTVAPTPAVPAEPEPEEVEAEPAPQENPPSTVAEAKLGAEGLARLRARHSEILARISENVPDPARQDELKAQAERLNPDTWVTDQEVAAGIDSYEAVFESIRTAVGRRRKRRRSRRPRQDQGSPAAAPDVPDDETPDPDAS
jgi:hypothetical protein